jgi:hypothetical protein
MAVDWTISPIANISYYLALIHTFHHHIMISNYQMILTQTVNEKPKMTPPHEERDNSSTPTRQRDNSQDYYKKGSIEAATESALTLAKIQHVSCLLLCWLYIWCIVECFCCCLVLSWFIVRHVRDELRVAYKMGSRSYFVLVFELPREERPLNFACYLMMSNQTLLTPFCKS